MWRRSCCSSQRAYFYMAWSGFCFAIKSRAGSSACAKTKLNRPASPLYRTARRLRLLLISVRPRKRDTQLNSQKYRRARLIVPLSDSAARFGSIALKSPLSVRDQSFGSHRVRLASGTGDRFDLTHSSKALPDGLRERGQANHAIKSGKYAVTQQKKQMESAVT